MGDIGHRAAQAIEERSKANGRTLTEEFRALGMYAKTKGDWKERGIDPSAYWLQQLAFAGFDVMWILTGKSDMEVPHD